MVGITEYAPCDQFVDLRKQDRFDHSSSNFKIT